MRVLSLAIPAIGEGIGVDAASSPRAVCGETPQLLRDAARWAATSLHVAAVSGDDAVDLNGHPVRIALSASPA